MYWNEIDTSSLIFMRSKLYGVSNSNHGTEIKTLQVHSEYDKFLFSYTGEYLTQFDRECSIIFKKMAINYKTKENTFEFSMLDFLRCTGNKKYGSNDKRLIYKSLMKNYNTIYSIEQENGSFEGRSINSFFYSFDKNKFIAELNPNWVDYFNGGRVCKYNYRYRLLLPHGFTRWLHSYWSTFDVIPNMNILELQLISGANYIMHPVI